MGQVPSYRWAPRAPSLKAEGGVALARATCIAGDPRETQASSPSTPEPDRVEYAPLMGPDAPGGETSLRPCQCSWPLVIFSAEATPHRTRAGSGLVQVPTRGQPSVRPAKAKKLKCQVLPSLPPPPCTLAFQQLPKGPDLPSARRQQGHN